MTSHVFPTSALSTGQDSSLYGVEQEDPSMKTTMEGGYVVSRAKHTRRPRKSFKTGFTDITTADKIILQAFFDEVRGGSLIFDWVDPSDLTVYQVRFTEKLNFKYTGRGHAQRWSVPISLEQA